MGNGVYALTEESLDVLKDVDRVLKVLEGHCT
jgi:hypothetical protein